MSIEELYQEANNAFIDQENEKALNLLAQLLQKSNDYAPAYALKGDIVNSDFDNPNGLLAIEYYTKAIESNPNSKEFRYKRANAYTLMPHQIVTKEGFDFQNQTKHHHFYEKAIADCDYITNEMESDEYGEDWIAGAYDLKAGAYLSMQKFEEAISNYEAAKGMSDRYASGSLEQIATIKTDFLSDYEGALAILDEYVMYVSNRPALEDHEPHQVVLSDSSKAIPYYKRGKLKIEHLNQKQEGLKDLKKAIEYDDSDFYKEEYENAK